MDDTLPLREDPKRREVEETQSPRIIIQKVPHGGEVLQGAKDGGGEGLGGAMGLGLGEWSLLTGNVVAVTS